MRSLDLRVKMFKMRLKGFRRTLAFVSTALGVFRVQGFRAFRFELIKAFMLWGSWLGFRAL